MIDISLIVKIGALFLAVSLGILTFSALRMPQDNPIEEVAEAVIENITGFDVDLSPTTPEKK